MAVHRILLGTLAALALGACTGGAPIDPALVSRPDQIQAGPGIVTGADGQAEFELTLPDL